MLGLIVISMILIYRLLDSRLGRSWNAIREDELAASANGINTVTTKLLAFAIGASTAGLAGVFLAAKLQTVTPNLFRFDVSFTVLAMVVLGGMGNIWGVAVGAFIIFMIQSVFLKQLNLFFDNVNVPILSDIDFLQYQFLLYGIALVGDDAAATRRASSRVNGGDASSTPRRTSPSANRAIRWARHPNERHASDPGRRADGDRPSTDETDAIEADRRDRPAAGGDRRDRRRGGSGRGRRDGTRRGGRDPPRRARR